jgi:hypothetical protein
MTKEQQEPQDMDFFGTFRQSMEGYAKDGIQAEVDTAKSWAQVGDSLLSAMLEKAEELGGEELRDSVQALALEDSFLIPNAQALITLEQLYPGSAQETVQLARAKLLGKLATD